MKASGSGFSKPATDLVQFLAYGGMRIGEAKNVTWGDCDFQRGEIIVRGDPETGTKNREVRAVPMIPDMRKLLERIKRDRPSEGLDAPVMRVWKCQRSIDRASRGVTGGHASATMSVISTKWSTSVRVRPPPVPSPARRNRPRSPPLRAGTARGPMLAANDVHHIRRLCAKMRP